ncbi:DUF1104 domain-containing protein [Arcobacter sp. F2176]|uniref:DUF1104 domain-containing protein n=1 Tax=unclassified Arcobacter TaxID=2593671 RepID=UPI00100BB6EF|nr:DUF1104 domain-containing protein [Arcobacter sp. F2176]RXJ80680.1 DUF1104 domain-containing protein [Arcobacter sp. F2176]
MKKVVLIFLALFIVTPLFAVDYSEMSTQELIEIIGFVKKENRAKFEKELKSRVSTMNSKEKNQYKRNIQKTKEKR